jgi:hypothetical protein
VNDLGLLELGCGGIIPGNSAINGSVEADIAGMCGMLIASAAHDIEGAGLEGGYRLRQRLTDGSLGRQFRSRVMSRHGEE